MNTIFRHIPLQGGYLRTAGMFLLLFIIQLHPDDLQNRYMLAQSYEQAGDFIRAKSMYEEVYAKQPGNIMFIQSLNRVYIQLKEFDNSERMLENSLKLMPADFTIIGLLGKTYYAAGREHSADSLWGAYINKNPSDPTPYKIFSSYAIELRDFEFAIKLLLAGKSATGNIKLFAFDLGYLYAITMQYRKAAEEYIALLKAAPEQYNAVQARVLTYIRKPDALPATMDVIKNAGYKGSAELTKLLAELYTEAADFESAFGLYKELDKQGNREGQEISQFGNRIYYDNNFSVSAKVFSYLIENYPRSAAIPQWKISYVRSLEGSVYTDTKADSLKWMPLSVLPASAAERYRKIIGMYEEIVALYPYSETAIDARIRTGYLYLFLGESRTGLEYFNKVTKDFPMYIGSSEAFRGKIEAHLVLGEIDAAYNTALGSANGANKSEQELNMFRLELAQLEFYKGNFSRAGELLTLITGSSKDNRANDALELSMAINGSMKDSVSLLTFAKAELETRRKNYPAALELYLDLSAKQAAPFFLKNLAQYRVAAIRIYNGDFVTAAGYIDSVVQKEKSIVADKLQYCLAHIYEYGLHDTKRAYSVYEDFLSKFPKSILIEEVREKVVLLRNKSS